MLLITGATGYIGRHLVKRLVEQGERPRCLVRNKQSAANVLPLDKIELVEGSTLDLEALKEAVQGIDTIVHAAFLTADRKQKAGSRYEETNVGGTMNLIAAARAAGVTRVIEISGLGTRPDKAGSYMQGRYLAEKLLMESGLGWTIIRPSVLFGADAPFIKGLVDLIKGSPVVPLLGGGKISFQPIYVEDVVSVILKVMREPEKARGKIYTIGGPEYYTFTQIVDLLLKATGKQRLKLPAPLPLVGIGAAGMELLLPQPPITPAAMTLFTFDNTTELNSVERDFGFTPISFKKYLELEGV